MAALPQARSICATGPIIDRRGIRVGRISIPKSYLSRAMSLASLVIGAVGPSLVSTLTRGAICKIAFAALRDVDASGGPRFAFQRVRRARDRATIALGARRPW
jgi:hypothetical protein